MAHSLVVRQRSSRFQAHFAEPAFGLLSDLPSLCRRLFAAFSQDGLKLTDLIDKTDGSRVGEAHLQCTLPRMTLKVFLDRIEVARSTTEPDSAVNAAVSAVLDHLETIKIRTYSCTLSLQGVLEGLRPEELIARFVTRMPDGLGPPRGSGAVFYFGPAEGRIATSLTVDRSEISDRGLFVQAYLIYDAQQVELAKVDDLGRQYLAAALTQLDLVAGGESDEP